MALADAGQSVLTISADPASNLSDVFATAAADTPTPVAGAAGLDIMDLDPQVAAASYRERVIAGLGAGLSQEERAADDALAGACTVEVAAFEAFARTLTDPTLAGRYDHVLFDTAPTGHTLRLLGLPAAWAGYLAIHPEGTRPLGPLTGISGQRSTFEQAVHALRDPDVTTMVIVGQPDTASLHEAARTLDELDALGMPRHLVINGVLTRPLPVTPPHVPMRTGNTPPSRGSPRRFARSMSPRSLSWPSISSASTPSAPSPHPSSPAPSPHPTTPRRQRRSAAATRQNCPASTTSSRT